MTPKLIANAERAVQSATIAAKTMGAPAVALRDAETILAECRHAAHCIADLAENDSSYDRAIGMVKIAERLMAALTGFHTAMGDAPDADRLRQFAARR